MRRYLIYIYTTFIVCTNSTRAQVDSNFDYLNCSNREFAYYMNSLTSEGNRYYMQSDRKKIAGTIARMEAILKERSNAGLLNMNDSMVYRADIWKLKGSYHYENMAYDANSYATALDCYLQAKDIYADSKIIVQGKDKLVLAQELAQLYYKKGLYPKALEAMQEVYDGYLNMRRNGELVNDGMFPEDWDNYLNIITQYAMCLARNRQFDKALSYVDTALHDYSNKESQEYYEILRRKGKILLLRDESTDSKQALSYYKQYLALQKSNVVQSLATMSSEQRESYWMRMRPFVADCYLLEGLDAGFLYDVTLFLKGLLLRVDISEKNKDNYIEEEVTWLDIQAKLKKDACAIEFVQYEKEDRQHMAALLLKKTGKPSFIPIASPDSILDYELSSGQTAGFCLENTSSKHKDKLYTDKIFSNLVWPKALLNAIHPAVDVYFSPDGYQHRLGMEYIGPSSSDKLKFHRLTSTRLLLQRSRPIAQTDSILLLGGVDYNLPSNLYCLLANDSLAYSHYAARGIRFGHLPSSLDEIRTIKASRDYSGDTILKGYQASEENFRTLSGKYPLICISTHGVFDCVEPPLGTDLKPSLSDETLSYSVLAFSGVNFNMQAEDFSMNNTPDGLLSAREISQMDMSNVSLAVISACQTGLGHITADGVYGLQRALKLAGVRSMLLSLWNVDDGATTLLTTSMYRYMHQGMSVYDAFMTARQDLTRRRNIETNNEPHFFDAATLAKRKKKVTLRNSYDAPRYTDAFILIDGY